MARFAIPAMRRIPPSMLAGDFSSALYMTDCHTGVEANFMPLEGRNEYAVRKLFLRLPRMTVRTFLDRLEEHAAPAFAERNVITHSPQWRLLAKTFDVGDRVTYMHFDDDFPILDIPDYILATHLLALDTSNMNSIASFVGTDAIERGYVTRKRLEASARTSSKYRMDTQHADLESTLHSHIRSPMCNIRAEMLHRNREAYASKRAAYLEVLRLHPDDAPRSPAVYYTEDIDDDVTR